MSKSTVLATAPSLITSATIEWQTDDTGHKVPVSSEFGDVYFSNADGLAESRHVFIHGNQLPKRLAALTPNQCFTIAELGFGTGLNVLAVWQLWRQLRATQTAVASARLHILTTEKHPIVLEDLTQILALWAQRAPELADLIAQLLANYPPLIGGCHRLSFHDDHLTLDIWLGDAAASLASLDSIASTSQHPITHQHNAAIDAWFLDGFAPSCNQSLWTDAIFTQMQRLSTVGSTVATYSCAGVVKRGLQHHGFSIEKIKGFGRKNNMLTAKKQVDDSSLIPPFRDNFIHQNISQNSHPQTKKSIVIGAGVAGLLTAWALATRGVDVVLVDKIAPLAGASGNPRALLAPKMTPIHHVSEHLHTLGYLYSNRLYRQLNKKALLAHTAPVLEQTGALDLLLKSNINIEHIAAYPNEMATTLTPAHAQQKSGLQHQNLSENLYLPQAALINPQALKTVILAHPKIHFQAINITQIEENDCHVRVYGYQDINNHGVSSQYKKVISITADHVVICAAYESHYLDARIFNCRKIRGQLSWFTPTAQQVAALPKLPLKYNGYCALFNTQTHETPANGDGAYQTQFLLGASFIRNEIATDIRDEEHQISRDKLVTAIAELENIIPTDTQQWQARAGVRTQTPDYHPMVGRLAASARLWTLSAMGAKGYAFAPLCAEALANMMLGEFVPLSIAMLARLSPSRSRLQTPLSEKPSKQKTQL